MYLYKESKEQVFNYVILLQICSIFKEWKNDLGELSSERRSVPIYTDFSLNLDNGQFPSFYFHYRYKEQKKKYTSKMFL